MGRWINIDGRLGRNVSHKFPLLSTLTGHIEVDRRWLWLRSSYKNKCIRLWWICYLIMKQIDSASPFCVNWKLSSIKDDSSCKWERLTLTSSDCSLALAVRQEMQWPVVIPFKGTVRNEQWHVGNKVGMSHAHPNKRMRFWQKCSEHTGVLEIQRV